MYKPVIYNVLLILFLWTSSSTEANSQGCSDAGFCTIGAIKHGLSLEKKFRHRVVLQTPVGAGDDNVIVFTPAIQYELRLNKLLLQAKVTGNHASGKLGTVFGAGDVFITGNYPLSGAGNWSWRATGGLKLPLDASNSSENGMPLPLQYQSSLGTVDIIAGITAANKDWNFSAAVQQPLTKQNKNGFLQEYWNDDPKTDEYPASNRFQRKGDVLLRISKDFSSGRKWQFNAGLLNIYHLGKDRYRAITPISKIVAIDGSQGLTINITGSAFYKVSDKMRIGVSGGAPVLARDVRPDGLTRRWVLSPEISWQF